MLDTPRLELPPSSCRSILAHDSHFLELVLPPGALQRRRLQFNTLSCFQSKFPKLAGRSYLPGPAPTESPGFSATSEVSSSSVALRASKQAPAGLSYEASYSIPPRQLAPPRSWSTEPPFGTGSGPLRVRWHAPRWCRASLSRRCCVLSTTAPALLGGQRPASPPRSVRRREGRSASHRVGPESIGHEGPHDGRELAGAPHLSTPAQN